MIENMDDVIGDICTALPGEDDKQERARKIAIGVLIIASRQKAADFNRPESILELAGDAVEEVVYNDDLRPEVMKYIIRFMICDLATFIGQESRF